MLDGPAWTPFPLCSLTRVFQPLLDGHHPDLWTCCFPRMRYHTSFTRALGWTLLLAHSSPSSFPLRSHVTLSSTYVFVYAVSYLQGEAFPLVLNMGPLGLEQHQAGGQMDGWKDGCMGNGQTDGRLMNGGWAHG